MHTVQIIMFYYITSPYKNPKVHDVNQLPCPGPEQKVQKHENVFPGKPRKTGHTDRIYKHVLVEELWTQNKVDNVL